MIFMKCRNDVCAIEHKQTALGLAILLVRNRIDLYWIVDHGDGNNTTVWRDTAGDVAVTAAFEKVERRHYVTICHFG